MHFIGLTGVPRRYYSNEAFALFDNLQSINILITVFAIIGALAQGLFLFNFFYSMYRGKNPIRIHGIVTRLNGLHRWSIFTVIGQVSYLQYIVGQTINSKPGKDVDFIPQTVPLDSRRRRTLIK